MIGLLVQYKEKGCSPAAARVSPEVTAWIQHDRRQDKCLLWFAQRRMAVAPVHFSPTISNTSEQIIDMLYSGIS